MFVCLQKDTKQWCGITELDRTHCAGRTSQHNEYNKALWFYSTVWESFWSTVWESFGRQTWKSDKTWRNTWFLILIQWHDSTAWSNNMICGTSANVIHKLIANEIKRGDPSLVSGLQAEQAVSGYLKAWLCGPCFLHWSAGGNHECAFDVGLIWGGSLGSLFPEFPVGGPLFLFCGSQRGAGTRSEYKNREIWAWGNDEGQIISEWTFCELIVLS